MNIEIITAMAVITILSSITIVILQLGSILAENRLKKQLGEDFLNNVYTIRKPSFCEKFYISFIKFVNKI